MTAVTLLDGKTVRVGDVVWFKSDHEQAGKITKIEQSGWRNSVMLHLNNPHGFGGEYLRYATDTVVPAAECWK
jgi:hypothetical protein